MTISVPSSILDRNTTGQSMVSSLITIFSRWRNPRKERGAETLLELLQAVHSGQEAFEATDKSEIGRLSFNKLFNSAMKAERDGLIAGLEVRRSMGVHSYGWPVKFKVKEVTPLGREYLQLSVDRPTCITAQLKEASPAKLD